MLEVSRPIEAAPRPIRPGVSDILGTTAVDVDRHTGLMIDDRDGHLTRPVLLIVVLNGETDRPGAAEPRGRVLCGGDEDVGDVRGVRRRRTPSTVISRTRAAQTRRWRCLRSVRGGRDFGDG